MRAHRFCFAYALFGDRNLVFRVGLINILTNLFSRIEMINVVMTSARKRGEVLLRHIFNDDGLVLQRQFLIFARRNEEFGGRLAESST